jgi:MYXO-CTERM domain-containing protein
MRRWFLGGVAVIVALGCSSSSPNPGAKESVGSQSSAIQGGTVDTSHTFAVGVCVGSPGQCQYTCSGALIAPNLVVSARHCVEQTPQTIDCASATFGGALGPTSAFYVTTSDSMNQPDTGWHSVQKIVTPTPTSVCGNDLSLIILSDTVAANEATPITPEVQYPITDHNRFSTTVTAIGYGITSPNSNTAGERHILENIQLACIPGDPQLDCGSATGTSVAAAEFVSGDGTCEGDSGSSAYEQTNFNAGRYVSLGVLSRGGVSSDGTQCQGGIYTRLDSWRTLIVQTVTQAATLGGYPVPSWTAAVPPDPSPDAGPTKTDAGKPSNPQTDSGSGSSGADIGSTCSANSDCSSGVCRQIDNGPLVCSQTCDANDPTTCPDGYACTSGYCFAKPSGGSSSNATGTTTTTTSSCSAAPAPRDPTKPIPWLTAALGLVAVRRRRKR